MKQPFLIALAIAAALSATAAAAPKSRTGGKPATSEPAAKSPDEAIDTTVGTTIVGDQESPIGLYITPWKDEYAERGLDRPARLLDEALLPIDPATFRRQIEYYETITAYRRSQQAAGAGKPQTP
ncbi:MAG: hypothetical protein NVS9B10_04860 [Nevskia sp.]